jgi:biotin carboxyl carrier protein
MAGMTTRPAAALDLGPLRVLTIDEPGDHLVVEPNGHRPPAEASILLLPEVADPVTGRRRREVVVDGWRFDVEVEPEARAALRERAAARSAGATHDGRLEIRAVIPGRVLSVDVAQGDEVKSGDRLLVVEAMKMQNEIRAPRSGRIATLAVGAGQTVELRDLMVELE